MAKTPMCLHGCTEYTCGLMFYEAKWVCAHLLFARIELAESKLSEALDGKIKALLLADSWFDKFQDEHKQLSEAQQTIEELRGKR